MLFSSHSRSASEGALGSENNDTGWSSGHSLATLLIIMHPKGTHSSERHTHTHRYDFITELKNLKIIANYVHLRVSCNLNSSL